MKITIIAEGKTESVFLPHLRNYLRNQSGLQDAMPRIDSHLFNGRIPTGEKLKRTVDSLLSGAKPSDYVIALTDVYTGKGPSVFSDADDAKQKMSKWVGNNDKFYPHVALYDFEAWLLPYWEDILRLAGNKRKIPASNPETVNHDKPPSYHIQEVFRTGNKEKSYVKTRDAGRILRDNDLSKAINECKELKSLINTILKLCNADMIP